MCRPLVWVETVGVSDVASRSKNDGVDDGDGGNLIYKSYSHQDLWKVSKCGDPVLPERDQPWILILVPFLTQRGDFL